MIIDAQLLASDGQVVTTTANSTNAIDLGSARDISRGEPVRAIARAVVGFAGGANIKVDLVESDASTLSTPNILASSPTVVTAAAVAGASLLDVPLPKVSKRYLGFSYTVSGTMSGGGAVTAGLVLESDSGAAFPATTGL